MKKTLFIGSTVLDVIVNIDHLPSLTEDINTKSISVSLGGCAYNASNILHQLDLPYLLASPVGTGLFASNVEKLLALENKKPFIKLKEDNGCCICLVNKEGERTFLCQHGVEYTFKKEWLKDIQYEDIDYVYVCGLEIEENTGIEIIKFLESIKGPKIIFAPGSRIMHIQKDKMDKILALSPILHLNCEEALSFTKKTNIEEASKALNEITNNTIILTCGSKGAYYYTKNEKNYVETVKTDIVDTIGAGDSHVGAVIAGLKQGKNIKESIAYANKIASKVVAIKGANIKKDELLEAFND